MIKTTLHITPHEVKLVAGKGSAIKSWMSKNLEPGLVEDAHILEPEKVGAIISEMFANQHLPKNRVTVSISGLPYAYRIIDMPFLKEDQVEEAIMRSLQGEMAISVEDLYVSWAPMVQKPDGVDYFIIGADRELTDAVIATMKAADIKDWGLELVPMSIARVAAASDAVIAYLDGEQLDIVLTANGYVREMHSTVIDYDRENVAEYIDQFANELLKLISFLQNSMEEDVDLTQYPIIVTGELVAHAYGEPRNTDEDEGFASRISRLTGHATELMEFPVSFPVSFSPHGFATNVGLFMKDCKKRNNCTRDTSQFQDVNIDILADRYRSRPARVPAWLAAVPVTIFVVALAGWTVNSANFDSTTERDALQVESVRLNIDLAQAKKAAADQTDLLKKIGNIRDTIQTVIANREALLNDQGMYVENMDKMRSALPDETFLTSMDLQDDVIRLSGIADSPYKAVDYVRALESAGYSPKLDEIGSEDLRGFTFRITIVHSD